MMKNENDKYRDVLKEVFQQKLKDHEVAVDDSDWYIISKRLHGQISPLKKIIRIWSSIAAGLIIILLFVIFRQEDHKPYTNLQRHFITKPSNQIENDSEKASRVTPPKMKDLVVKSSLIAIKEKQIHENNTTPTTTEEKTETIAEINQKPENQSKEMIIQSNKNEFFSFAGKRKKSEKKENLLLAFSIGSSGGIGNNSNLNYSNQAFIPDRGQYNDEKNLSSSDNLIPSDINMNTEYIPPLSFGITARKNIGSHWGMESGLIYTYLSSKYKWTDNVNMDAKQQIHYLGIPLNGIVYLWNNNNSKWDIYLSAGFMLEKGIHMKTTRNQYYNNHILTTVKKNSIDGFQWSFNGSLGITYNLSSKIGIYFEPRFSYYFDNNQPQSIRTDWPVTIGIGAGMRFSF